MYFVNRTLDHFEIRLSLKFSNQKKNKLQSDYLLEIEVHFTILFLNEWQNLKFCLHWIIVIWSCSFLLRCTKIKISPEYTSSVDNTASEINTWKLKGLQPLTSSQNYHSSCWNWNENFVARMWAYSWTRNIKNVCPRRLHF